MLYGCEADLKRGDSRTGKWGCNVTNSVEKDVVHSIKAKEGRGKSLDGGGAGLEIPREREGEDERKIYYKSTNRRP